MPSGPGVTPPQGGRSGNGNGTGGSGSGTTLGGGGGTSSTSGGGSGQSAGGTGGTAAGTGGGTGSGGASGSDAAAPAEGGAAGAGGGVGTPGGGGQPAEPATPGPTDLTKHRHSKVITLDTTAAGANVAGDVAGFPVAVRLNAMNFDFTQAMPNGEDLRFAAADGKLLPYTIELWDPAGKSALAWVKVDVKGNNATQSIVMRWGNPAAESGASSKSVFSADQGYLGVYHLDEEGMADVGGYKDASAHGAHLTGVMMAPGSRVESILGRGTRLENARMSYKKQWLRLDDMAKNAMFNPTGRSITASLWTKPFSYAGRSRYGSYETVMSKGDTSWTIQRVGSRDWEACTKGPGNVTWHNCAIVRGGVVTDQWVHFAIVMTDSNLTFYVNGERKAATGNGKRTSDHPFGIGQQTQALADGREWDGIVDEARVLAAAKDANWVKLDFESQKEGSKLLSFGPTKTE